MKELIRLGIIDHLVENLGAKVSQRMVFDGQYHTHDFYELEFILNGTIRTEINGTIYDLSEGSLVLLTPSDVHKYIGLKKPAELINLAFITKEIEHNSFAFSVLSGKSIVCKLSKESKENVLFLIQKIKTESMNDGLLSNRYVSFLLSCLMIELQRIKKEHGMDSEEQLNETIRSAIVYIRNNFKEQITLEDVAKIMNVSTVYASKLIRNRLGCGFKNYLMELRLEYASSLLTNTQETISDISYFSGYNSVSYFSRGFKKKFGISPAEYRKRSRSK